MISAFVPILDAFVIAGTSESQIQVVQFQNLDNVPTFTGNLFKIGLEERLEVTRPISTSIIGKCSHRPVNDLTHLYNCVSAASACTLSTWDLTKNSRVRLLTTPDHLTCCTYVGANLLAVAGHGRLVHLYDTRLQNKNLAPVWSAVLASDNLYTVAADGSSLFCGGADGSIYGVDLRAHRRYKWALQPNPRGQGEGGFANLKNTDSSQISVKTTTDAILDLKISGSELIVTLESGRVCGVSRLLQDRNCEWSRRSGEITKTDQQEELVAGGDFTFNVPFLPAPVASKIGCDVLNAGKNLYIATGGVGGGISYYEFENRSGLISPRKIVKIGPENSIVTSVRWGPRGLFASMGDALCRLSYIT